MFQEASLQLPPYGSVCAGRAPLGAGARGGVLLLPGPSLVRSGSLLAEGGSPAAVIFAAITSGILPHAAQAQSSQAGTLGAAKRKKSFSLLPGALPPAHASPPACSASATTNISKHPDGKTHQSGFFTSFIFPPLSNCTVA